MADRLTLRGGRAAKLGSYARREQDWAFQSNLAAGEITQIFKQLRAAQIREADGRAGAGEPPAADQARRGDREVPERRGSRLDAEEPSKKTTNQAFTPG